MPSDAYEYVTSNVGLVPALAHDDTYEYLTSNVGYVTPIASDDSYEYLTSNVGYVFTPDLSSTEFLTGEIVSTTPDPYIYFLDPADGYAGSSVQINGLGFGVDAAEYGGVVEVLADAGWTAIPVDSWVHYSASPGAYTDGRVIDETSISSEHEVLTFKMPFNGLTPATATPVRVRTEGP